MSTIDTSTWNPDADFNTEIEGIPLNADAGIAQTWQALRVLMAAVKGDGDAIKAMIDVMQGATASADGASGLVPAPEAGDQDKVLKGDGTWGTASTAAEAESVPWSGVTGKPSTFSPSSHAHGSITNDGKLDTASRAVVTDGNKAIGVSSVTATELGHLSGVTSAVQTQLNTKAADADVVHLAGNETITDMKTIQGESIGWSISYGNYTMSFMVGVGGVNRGLWDSALNSWVVYADASEAYFKGNADTATKLAVAKKLKTDLASSTDATFDGSANQESIPVTGILPVVNGGTGSSTKNFVDLNTAQTVGGEKTLTTSPKIKRNNPYLHFIETDQERGVDTGSAAFQGLYFKDKNEDALAELIVLHYYKANGKSESAMRFYNWSETTLDNGYLEYNGTYATDSVRYFFPNPNNSVALGSPGKRFATVYASNGTIQTSDENKKCDIHPIPDVVLDAWGDVSFFGFKFKDSVENKGSSARNHSGLIAQRIDAVFRNHGLDGFNWGLLCRDQGEAVDRIEKNEEGKSVAVHEDAYDNWSLRYDEVLCMEAAYQRRRADRLEKRLSEIEAKLSQLLNNAPDSGEGEK